ncbi:hypothetical protein RRG08_048655 [Elysia crispata]|uniref:Uncharacterized protein n=1 Tax=Elysia crispata TaxID=231223 RepID=A0AAE1DWE3_9GAST|nr:hypothetical protein RRG08_048655 [Elysia crispata]
MCLSSLVTPTRGHSETQKEEEVPPRPPPSPLPIPSHTPSLICLKRASASTDENLETLRFVVGNDIILLRRSPSTRSLVSAETPADWLKIS